MKLYSFDSIADFQLLKKTCFELDNKINSIIHFIDTFNPNYIILNRKERKGEDTYSYYTEQGLVDLGIKEISEDSTEDVDDNDIIINLYKMFPHQLIENTYGKDIYFRTTEGEDYSHNIVVQGYAIRHDGYNSDGDIQYSVIPLSPSGGYYLLTNKVLQKENNTYNLITTWSYDERAIDKYGLNSVISVCLPGTRFYYNINDGSPKLRPITMEERGTYVADNYAGSIMDANQWLICARDESNCLSLWDNTVILGHEIVLFDNNTSEELFVDESYTTSKLRVGESPKSRYIINTNLTSNPLLDSDKLFINFY